MSITLDPNLATTQDSMTRHPLCELLSGQFTSAIPFDGEYFNSDVQNETEPALICHSTGRLGMVYSRESGGGEAKNLLYYNYTNTTRSQWYNELVYDAGATVEVWGKSLVELANGNIGIVFVEKAGGSRHLKYMVIGVTGSVVVSPTVIETFTNTSEWVANPHVMQRSTEDYYLTYAHEEITGSGEVADIMNRKSADFSDWGESGEALSLASLDPTRRRDHPFVIEPGTGNMILGFDYQDFVSGEQEIVNVYTSESDDVGETWGTPSGETVFDTYGHSARKPVLAEDSENDTKLAYFNEIQVLHANEETAGWCYNGPSCPGAPVNIHYDPSTGMLYSTNIHPHTGIKNLCSVVVMDVDSWTVHKCYSDETSPAYSSLFTAEHCWWQRNQGDGHYVSVGTCEMGLKAILLIDDSTETIKEYYFRDDETYSLTKNIDVDWRGVGDVHPKIKATAVDADTDRLYVYITYGYYWGSHHWFGYIDCTETADPVTGKYTWHEIFYEAMGGAVGDDQRLQSLFNSMVILPDVDYAIFAYGGDVDNWKGGLRIYGLTSGSLIKDYNIDDYSGFHYRGAKYPAYYDGAIYYSFDYETLYNQQDRRGLGKIVIATDQMSYIVPTYDTGIDDYKLWQKKSMGDGRLLISTTGYGVQTFHTGTQEWTEYSNDTLSGFTPDEVDDLGHSDVAYDSIGQTIFATKSNVGGADYEGLLAFSELGAWKRTVYRTGTWTTKWNFDAEANLSLYTLDWDGSIAIDEEDTMWMVWTRLDSTEKSNKWDKSDADFDLSDYMTGPVEATWNIEQPNQLSFSCSNGHLFDPNNQMSILSGVVKRGREISLKFGELSGETPYWQNQGTFVVQEAGLSYKRGEYPTINVRCEDVTNLWTEGTHPASEYFDGEYPENVLAELLGDFAGLVSGEYLIPYQGTMSNSHKVYHQWLDTSLMDMLQDVLDHFGYIPNINVNGQWVIKEVDFDGSVSHVYPDNTKIIEYSPDDSYSNYINRVVVKGETRSTIEVLYAEEEAASLSGTMGWWGCKETKTVYYSEDRVRTCRNPRLVIVEPPNINLFFTKKGGGDVAITDEDVYETWVEIYVEAPNLIWVCVAAIAACVATGVAAQGCDQQGGGLFGVGGVCGAYIFMLSLELQVLAYILGAMANYYVQIWAQPVGHEKQSFQAQANDIELQNELNGLIVTEEIDDPFCYDYATAYVVADREMDIIKAQRKRGRFMKLAHLQDEITDIIQIVHPYSGNNLRFMITNLKRIFTKADSPGGEGSFIDQIEGWRIL